MNQAEEYSLLSNVGYELEQGVPIQDIEDELKSYGLDYTIDPELSDDKSVVLKQNNKIVHSIRGTKPTELLDLLNDLRIGLGLQTVLNTLLSKPYLQPSLLAESKARTGRSGLGLHSIPDSEILMNYIKSKVPVGYKAMIPKSINPELRSFKHPKTPIEFIKSPYGAPLITAMATKSIEKLSNLILPPSIDRFDIEDKKYEKIQEKYPNEDKVFTGHSLGGAIANYLGKKYYKPSITFNAAPNRYLQEQPTHPSSVVYRTKTDPISYLREAEAEKVVNLDSKFYNSHSLANFFPQKKQVVTPPVPSFFKSTPKIKPILKTSNFCLDNPEAPICKKNRVVYNV